MKKSILYMQALLVLCLISLTLIVNAQTISYSIYAINYRNYNNNCDFGSNEEGRFFPEAYDNVTGWTGCPGPNKSDDGNYPGGTGCEGDATGGGYNCARYRLLKNVSNTSAIQFGLFTSAYEDDVFTNWDCGVEDCGSNATGYYNFTSYPQCTNNDITLDAGGRYQITFRMNWRYTNVISGALSASSTTICAGTSTNFTIAGGTPGNKPRTWIGAVPSVGNTNLISGWNECSDCYDNMTSFSHTFNTPGVYLVRTHSRNCLDEWNWGSYSEVWITVQSATNNPGVITAPSSICLGSSAAISNVTAATTGTPASTGPNYYYYYQRTSAPTTGWVMYDGPTANLSSNLPAAVTGTAGTYLLARNSAFACFGQVSAPFINLTVNQPSTLGTLSNAGPVNFCNASGNFGTPLTVSGQTGTIAWEWGSNNGAWNTWLTGASSDVCCFPKKVSNSDGNADRIRYRVTNGACPAVTSSTILIVNRYNEAPSSLAASSTTYCANAAPATITLTASFPANINKNGLVAFYSGSCGGTLVGTVTAGDNTATAALTITAPSTTTTYYARYEPSTGTGCSNTACVSTTVTVNTLSVAPTGITGTATICNGSSTTLTLSGGSAGTGATAQWFAGSCGSAVIGTGNSIMVSPIANTAYFVRYTGTCNTTACASTIVTVNALSTTPASITGTTSICNGSSTTLTSTGGTLGGDALDIWYSGSCGTEAFTQEWTTIPYTTNETTVNSIAGGVLNISSTGGDPMIYMAALGSYNPSTYRYIQLRYRVTAGTAGIAEIFFYNANHGFALGGESATGSLISDGAWHIMNIDMASDPDYTTGGNITGWRFDWANAPGVTMDIDFISLVDRPMLDAAPSITVSPTTTTTYYVSRRGACNTTTCASAMVTVNTLSMAPTGITGTTTICNGSSTTLTLSGGSAGTGATAEWFAGSCGGTLVGTGNSITISPSSGTTYFVRYNGTCNTTTCASAMVTVNTLSTAPSSITGALSICSAGGSTTLSISGGSVGTGATEEWFEGSCGSAVIGTGNSITVSPSTSTIYYVRYNGTCNITTCITAMVTVGGTANVILAPTDQLAIVSTCDDGAWTYYESTTNPSKYVFAINWNADGGALGNSIQKAAAIVNINKSTSPIGTAPSTIPVTFVSGGGSPGYYSCADASTSQATFAMQRYWNVNVGGGGLSEPVNVRFFFDPLEYDAVINAANTWSLANGGYVEGPHWFKTIAAPDGVNNTWNPGSDMDAITVEHSGWVMDLNNHVSGYGFENGVRYVQFDGITSFSGGGLTVGVGNGTALPLDLIYFTGTRGAETNRLEWGTAQERNVSHFEVQRSSDAIHFNAIGAVNAIGNSAEEEVYHFIDATPLAGDNYYRMKMIDSDGSSTMSNIINISRPVDQVSLVNLYPNPAKTTLNFELYAPSVEEVSIKVLDVLGREVFSSSINLQQGLNTNTLDVSQFTPGLYFLNVTCCGGKVITYKFTCDSN